MKRGVKRSAVNLCRPLVIEVVAGYARCSACSEPRLGAGREVKVIRSLRAAHLRGNPTWFDAVGQHIWPVTRGGKSKQDRVKLGVRVGLHPGPASRFPGQVAERGITLQVKPGAHVNQALGSLDHGGQNVGRQRVHGKDMGQAIHCGDALALLEADSGIVNDGIEGAQFIDAGSKRLGFCDAGKVPDECRLRAGNLSDGMGRPGVIWACSTT